MSKSSIINQLHQIGAIQFGSFVLKSGIESPFYLDLRLIISYPALLREISLELWNLIRSCQFDLICGVPYTALPIATTLSITHDIPMILKRKEVKEYGTKRLVEGAYQPGQTCLMIEDIITSGASILETIIPIEHQNLQVSDIAVIIDRAQGGREIVERKGFHLHALFTIHEVIDHLEERNKITPLLAEQVRTFVRENRLP